MKHIPEFLRGLLRPLYLPVTNALRARLVSSHAFIRHPALALPTPWDFMQFQVERRLHDYLHCSRSSIRKIVIVGANIGNEVPLLSASYPEATFVCYEPSPRYFPVLQERFGPNPKVSCRRTACGETVGTATFHELPMDGNGSLLAPDLADWQAFNQWPKKPQTEEFQVNVTTLDQDFPEAAVDLLWADVQGFEKQVLLGAGSVLTRTRAVFLEVATVRNPYEGGAMFDDLDSILSNSGFNLAGLGLNPWNFTGNALWIREVAASVCRKSPRD